MHSRFKLYQDDEEDTDGGRTVGEKHQRRCEPDAGDLYAASCRPDQPKCSKTMSRYRPSPENLDGTKAII